MQCVKSTISNAHKALHQQVATKFKCCPFRFVENYRPAHLLMQSGRYTKAFQALQ